MHNTKKNYFRFKKDFTEYVTKKSISEALALLCDIFYLMPLQFEKKSEILRMAGVAKATIISDRAGYRILFYKRPTLKECCYPEQYEPI